MSKMPKTKLNTTEENATISEFCNARQTSCEANNSLYQRVVKDTQLKVNSFELKEKITRIIMGTYKNKYADAIASQKN